MSYAREDRDVAEEVSGTLKAMSISTTDVFGTSAPGDAWATAIEASMDLADAVIALISKRYIGSPYTFSELRSALENKKRLILLIIERNTPVPALLEPYVALDISDPRVRKEAIRSLGISLLSDDQSLEDRSSQLASVEAQLQAVRQASLLEEYRAVTRLTRLNYAVAVIVYAAALVIVSTALVIILGIVDSNQALISIGIAALSALIGAVGTGLARRRIQSLRWSAADSNEVRR